MAIRYGSRKFIILGSCVGMTVIIPIIYSLLKIEGSVTITTLGLMNGLAGLYFGANLVEKKLGLGE